MTESTPFASRRAELFDEREGATSAFIRSGWRGAIIYRDSYGAYGIPRVLWDALTAASLAHRWIVLGDGRSDDGVVGDISSSWDEFQIARDNPAFASKEWLMFDDSNEWALLVDFDAAILGCSASFAARMDRTLDRYGSSLEAISKSEFEDGESWDLFRAVVYPQHDGADPPKA